MASKLIEDYEKILEGLVLKLAMDSFRVEISRGELRYFIELVKDDIEHLKALDG